MCGNAWLDVLLNSLILLTGEQAVLRTREECVLIVTFQSFLFLFAVGSGGGQALVAEFYVVSMAGRFGARWSLGFWTSRVGSYASNLSSTTIGILYEE